MSDQATSSSEWSSCAEGSQPHKPRKELTVDDLQAIEAAAHKIHLIHELAFNSKYQLESPQQSSPSSEGDIYAMVKTAMHAAFWDKLRTELDSTPPQFSMAFKLLAELKEVLLELCGRTRNWRHEQTEATLDLELFKQQADNDSFDVSATATFIIDTLAGVCAPARDEQVAALRDVTDLTDLFRGIFELSKVMQRDVANCYISLYRPVLQHHSVDQERKNFAVLIHKLPDPLKRSKMWLESCVVSMKQGGNCGGDTVNITHASVFRNAYSSFLQQDRRSVELNLPETFAADRERILHLKDEFDRLIFTASVLLSSINFFSTDLPIDGELWRGVKDDLLRIVTSERMKDEESLKELIVSLAEQIYIKVEDRSKMKSDLVDHLITFIPIHSNPIHKVLKSRAVSYFSRMAEFLRTTTSTTTTADDACPPPSGLNHFLPQLKQLSQTYSTIVNRNYFVYMPFYNPILKTIFDEQGVSS